MDNTTRYSCDVVELGDSQYYIMPSSAILYFDDTANQVNPRDLPRIKVLGTSSLNAIEFEPLGSFVDPSQELQGAERLEYLHSLETWPCQQELDKVLRNVSERYYICGAAVDISGMSLYVVNRNTGALYNFMVPLQTLTISFYVDGRTVSYMQRKTVSEFGEPDIQQGLLILSTNGSMEAITLEPSRLSSLWTRLVITRTDVPVRISS